MLRELDFRRALRRFGLAAPGAIFAMTACLQACASLGDRPELHPERWAPQSVNREWNTAATSDSRLALADIKTQLGSQTPAPTRSDHEYDLASLIEIALGNNPGMRRGWAAALSAAARFGAAQAPYYPQGL